MVEFSRIVLADKVQGRPRDESISASPEECRLLAPRLGLEELKNLSGRMTLKRILPGELIQVLGHLSADVVQSCVVSLDPVPQHIETDFEVFYSEDADNKKDFSEEGAGDLLAEPILEGKIDIGELVTQNLSLALNPYPRSRRATLRVVDAEKQHIFEEQRPNPFAVLASLRKEDKTET